ncbi:(2Fe-2S)-binding protein [Cloacibacillus evryensis]|uniref:(2Fe-2S)-binding protein n=1 Tax=Cloacibacillus evryensis TaxID=508460 RepID=A0AAW5KAP1_9BACT|nr:(2Fe-2S)-binding protein [Cloacibacillus evryensis]MCQ4815598.1 (2Fe-2S)-binding protein [Cloacibacillus evryensis]
MMISFELNHKKYRMNVDPTKRLVDFLRDEMGLTGTKEGCGEGECGACTVILDKKAVHACLVLTGQINKKSLLTVEGLAQNGEPSPLQKAFIKHGAVQCGYCTPGMLMSASALLMETPRPTEAEVRLALAGNICRCGDYSAIVDAVLDAAEAEARR